MDVLKQQVCLAQNAAHRIAQNYLYGVYCNEPDFCKLVTGSWARRLALANDCDDTDRVLVETSGVTGNYTPNEILEQDCSNTFTDISDDTDCSASTFTVLL